MFFNRQTIGGVLRATARARSDHVAVVQGELMLTYRELDEAVDKLGAHLIAAGIRKGDRAAFMFLNQWEILVAYYAIARIGAVCVSLNYRLTPGEIEYQLRKTNARVVLYDDSFGELFARLPASLIEKLIFISSAEGGGDRHIPVSGNFVDILRKGYAGRVEVDVESSDDSGIWFTSGTTGSPKGAIVRHASSIASADITALVCNFGVETRFLATAPMFHRGAMEDMHLAITLVGATHVLLPRFEPKRALELIESEKISHAFIVPTMSRLILQLPGCETYDLTSMERWISASAPFPAELATAIQERLRLRDDVVMNAYGITESLLNAACYPREMRARPGSVGRAVPKMQVRIVDAQHTFVADGEVGEIVTSGPTTFRTYLDDEAAFRSAVFQADDAVWYNTGDVGYRDEDGYIYIVDRKKDMIISGGENIYCVEVESAIARHADVSEVAVVGAPDELWGERVVAFVVPKPGASLDQDTVLSFCQDLAGYKRPREVKVIAAFPRNSFGKIQKAELRKLVAERAP
ncbi:MAG: AMP-binding protein [Xanthobacteraceae bacterium]